MKTTLAFAIFLFLVNIVNSQSKLDCDFNLHRAIQHYRGDSLFAKDIHLAKQYLQPCLAQHNPLAQLFMGRFLVDSKDTNNHKKGFEWIKKSAAQDNATAATDLGVLFKYGKGCKVNIRKAKKWFKKAYELGDDKAAYTIGYLYLKGFHPIKQDYKKAISWFEKSNYPMAKYWLGVCHLKGYGTDINTTKAMMYLGIKNSAADTLIVASSTKGINSNQKTPTVAPTEEIDNSISLDIPVTTNSLLGTWKGNLLLLDWSATHIEHAVPIEFNFKKLVENNETTITITVNKQKQVLNYSNYDESYYFENLNITLPHDSYKKEIPNSLQHQLLGTDFTITALEDNQFLTGYLDSYIQEWNEIGAPMFLTLKKADENDDIKEDALLALDKQVDQFIKLYPNPFQHQLIIQYELVQAQFTEVKIQSFNGSINRTLKPSSFQQIGKHQFDIDSSSFPNGIYIVSILLEHERKTRIIVKN